MSKRPAANSNAMEPGTTPAPQRHIFKTSTDTSRHAARSRRPRTSSRMPRPGAASAGSRSTCGATMLLRRRQLDGCATNCSAFAAREPPRVAAGPMMQGAGRQAVVAVRPRSVEGGESESTQATPARRMQADIERYFTSVTASETTWAFAGNRRLREPSSAAPSASLGIIWPCQCPRASMMAVWHGTDQPLCLEACPTTLWGDERRAAARPRPNPPSRPVMRQEALDERGGPTTRIRRCDEARA